LVVLAAVALHLQSQELVYIEQAVVVAMDIKAAPMAAAQEDWAVAAQAATMIVPT
jgi:hypothetical protein